MSLAIVSAKNAMQNFPKVLYNGEPNKTGLLCETVKQKSRALNTGTSPPEGVFHSFKQYGKIDLAMFDET